MLNGRVSESLTVLLMAVAQPVHIFLAPQSSVLQLRCSVNSAEAACQNSPGGPQEELPGEFCAQLS